MKLELYFELVGPVAISQNSKNSNEITLCVDDKSMLQSFRIKCGSEDNAVISAIHKANRFVNYLSFQTGLYVSHKHPRKVINGKITTNSRGLTIDTILVNSLTLDLTDSNLDTFLSNASIDNLGLAHFASGQRALDEQNYPEAIREFYLTIEESGILEEDKYKKIRNAVSHYKIKGEDTIRIVREVFGITVNNGDSSDVTDPRIYGVLETEAKKLREICLKHVAQTTPDLV